MRLIKMALVGLAFLAFGCGGDDKKSDPGPASGSSLTGTLSDGGQLALTCGLPTTALVEARSDEATASTTLVITGTIKYPGNGGQTYDVTGTYDSTSKSFTVTGSGYSLTGTFSNGVVSGAYTATGGVTGTFVVALGDSSAVTRYCGSYQSNDQQESGRLTVVTSGGHAFVLTGEGVTLTGTVSGTTITVTAGSDGGGTATGTISGTSVSGTYAHSSGQTLGTWSVTVAACATN